MVNIYNILAKLILAALIVVSNMSFAQEYWLTQPSPTAKLLTRIQFADTMYGWASGDSGTVIHTSNGGLNWVIQNTGIIAYPIDDMFFLNRRLGWAVSNDYLFMGTRILKTSNGGDNWQITFFPDTAVAIQTVYFLDSLTGYAGGSFPGKIYKTINGGNNWFECHIDTNYCPIVYLFPKLNFSFLNYQTGYVCGGQFDIQGMVWKTSDSGNNWYTFCVAPEPLKRIKSLYPNKVIACGGDLEFGASSVQSIDTGKTWIYDVIGPHDDTSYFGIGFNLAFRTPTEVWVPLGYGQAWAVSLDSGNKTSPWLKVRTPNDALIYDALFLNPFFGWACGSQGVLLKYNTEVIGIAPNGNNVPTRNILFQNYPNPFNPFTTISYYLSKNSFARITVYDLTGKVLYDKLEGYLTAGFHKFRFSSDNLASGVYFYKIEAGEFSEAKKMILIK